MTKELEVYYFPGKKMNFHDEIIEEDAYQKMAKAKHNKHH
jgi:hypothetical protein